MSDDTLMYVSITLLITAAVGGAIFLALQEEQVAQEMQDTTEEPEEAGTHACTPEQRNTDVCIQVHQPVCGSDGKTYSNSCFACMNARVEFWTEGEC